MDNLIQRAYEARVDDVNPGERTLVAKIATDAVDRMKEVVLPKGIDVRNYLKNPVVLWCHNLECPPIGKALWAKPGGDDRSFVSKVQFAPTDFAMQLFALYQGEFLRQWSIGALPVDGQYGPPTPAEIRARPELAAAVRVYRKLALHEFSACPVGMNQETATIAVSKGLIVPELLKAALPAAEPDPDPEPEPELPRLGPVRTFGQAHAALVRGLRAGTEARKAAALDEVRATFDLMQGKV